MKITKQRTKKPPRGVHSDKTHESPYQGVNRYIHPVHKHVWYSARVGKDYCSYHETERDAAKQVDKVLISMGRHPVNVFKAK